MSATILTVLLGVLCGYVLLGAVRQGGFVGFIEGTLSVSVLVLYSINLR